MKSIALVSGLLMAFYIGSDFSTRFMTDTKEVSINGVTASDLSTPQLRLNDGQKAALTEIVEKYHIDSEAENEAESESVERLTAAQQQQQSGRLKEVQSGNVLFSLRAIVTDHRSANDTKILLDAKDLDTQERQIKEVRNGEVKLGYQFHVAGPISVNLYRQQGQKDGAEEKTAPVSESPDIELVMYQR